MNTLKVAFLPHMFFYFGGGGDSENRNPLGLATALQKLDAYAHRIPMQGNEVASHLFIVNPFTAKSLMNMFSTHPPIGERVKCLKEMRFTS